MFDLILSTILTNEPSFIVEPQTDTIKVLTFFLILSFILIVILFIVVIRLSIKLNKYINQNKQ